MNTVFEKEEAPSDSRKTLAKPPYKKGDKSECGNYRGISLVFVGSKLLSNVILFRLRDAVDKVLREKQCGFRKGRGCASRIFSLRLIIEQYLSFRTSLVLNFIGYVQALDSVDRRVSAKVLSLYYIEVISTMYKDNTATIRVGNEVSSWLRIKSEVKQDYVGYLYYGSF
ncbi:uncharacterized protein LOC136031782 [Artemia franciscana]|uniref:uncharacterized protein LOC136031782 n=1 Tax=Artemia franciscana TaxID=6661 RepID=UPI0032DAE7C0